MAERSRRVAEIRAWLAQHPEAPDELRVTSVDELGWLLFSLGDFDEALTHWREVELPLHRRLADARSQAVTMGRIADVLQARGQLDEALRIRQEEQLPVYERLGDVREKAVTMGKIADVLQARGQLDEALRIRQ
jgi:tetratricopeptide (TPR) repeat protein